MLMITLNIEATLFLSFAFCEYPTLGTQKSKL